MALVFFDLDGTILNKGRIVPGIVEAISVLKENGHTVAIATGRNPNLLGSLNDDLKIDHIVYSNGGYALSHGKVIFENYIPFNLVNKMMDAADQYPFDLVIEYFDDYLSYRKDSSAADDFSSVFKLPEARLDSNRYPNRPVFSMLMFSDEAVKDIKDNFPELQFNLTSAFGYDVNVKGKLKAEGVNALMKHLGYNYDQTYAFGDGHNDITMLKEVKYGIAMGNAFQALKDVAFEVTDDVDKDGVIKALKKHKLI